MRIYTHTDKTIYKYIYFSSINLAPTGLSRCWIIRYSGLKKHNIIFAFCHQTVCISQLFSLHFTGYFMMFCMITTIYNKKRKGPTLMKFFTATRKLKIFLTPRGVRCVHHGRQNFPEPVQHFQRAITCFLLAQTLIFSKLFKPRTNDLFCQRVLCLICMKCTLHINHRLARVLLQHTKRLLPPERPFSYYIDSQCLAAEL